MRCRGHGLMRSERRLAGRPAQESTRQKRKSDASPTNGPNDETSRFATIFPESDRSDKKYPGRHSSRNGKVPEALEDRNQVGVDPRGARRSGALEGGPAYGKAGVGPGGVPRSS